MNTTPDRALGVLFDESPVTVLIVGASGRIQFANRAAAVTFECPDDDLVGLLVDDLFPAPSSDSGPHSEPTEGSWAIARSPATRETRAVHVRTTYASRLCGGSVVLFVENLSDPHLAKENQLHAARLQAAGGMTGRVAHDLNNVASVIQAFAEMALDDLDAASPLREDMGEILEACDRATRILASMLEFSQPNTDSAVLADQVIRGLVTTMSELVGERVTIHTDLPANLPPLRIDRGSLEQIVIDLVLRAADAIKHMGTIEVTAKPVFIGVGALDVFGSVIVPDRYVRLDVIDHGPTIPMEDRALLFAPPRSGSNPSVTTGGLTIVHRLTEGVGGRVVVGESPGGGAAFQILLPLARLSTTARPAGV